MVIVLFSIIRNRSPKAWNNTNFCATPSGFRWMLTYVLQGLTPLPMMFHPFGVCADGGACFTGVYAPAYDVPPLRGYGHGGDGVVIFNVVVFGVLPK